MYPKSDSFVLLLLLIGAILLFSSDIKSEEEFLLDTLEPTKKEVIEEPNYYDTCINYLKKYETFQSKRYICGSELIGYGHQLRKDDSISYEITELQADSLLRRDFDKSIKFVAKNTNLSGTELLAISCFVFNVGTTAFMNSSLKKLIDKKKDICSEMMKWVKFPSNGKLVTSNSLKKRRIWELKLFYKSNRTVIN